MKPAFEPIRRLLATPAPRATLVLGLAVLPVSFEPSPTPPLRTDPRQPETILEVHGGSGAFAVIARGCSDEVLSAQEVEFVDASVALEHRFSAPFNIGVRAGLVETEPGEIRTFSSTTDPAQPELMRYVNPHVALSTREIELDLGVLIADDDLPQTDSETERVLPTVSVRLGSERRNVRIGFLDGAPLYSSGGPFRVTVSIPMGERVDGAFGLGGGAYDEVGFIAQARVRLSEFLRLHGGFRGGSSEGVSESAVYGGIAVHLPY